MFSLFFSSVVFSNIRLNYGRSGPNLCHSNIGRTFAQNHPWKSLNKLHRNETKAKEIKLLLGDLLVEVPAAFKGFGGFPLLWSKYMLVAKHPSVKIECELFFLFFSK